MYLDHVGCLTGNMDASIAQLESLGYDKETDILYDVSGGGYEGRDIAVCFMRNGGWRIELVQPLSEASDVYRTLRRHGEGPYHFCYRTGDIREKMAELKAGGYVAVQEPKPAIVFQYAPVAFLYKKGVGLVELLGTDCRETKENG